MIRIEPVEGIAFQNTARRYDGLITACSTMGTVMRWLLLLATMLSWGLCFTRHGPGAFGFWFLLGIVGAIATTLAFVQARIEANAQPDLRVELLRNPYDPNKPQQK